MSDRDDLARRGIPFFVIVDDTGTGGVSSTYLCRSRGLEPICEVNSSGVSAGGNSLNTLRSRGVAFYCPVTENGVTSDAVTIATLRNRGIPFYCIVSSGGVAVGGTATLNQLAARVYNWGHSGASSTVLSATTFTAASGMNLLAQIAPDLTIIEGGIGNSWRTSISIAQTKIDVTAMVVKAKLSGDVILIVTPWDSSGSGNAAQQSDYNAMLYQVAVEQNCGLIDFRSKPGWTSSADEAAAGNVSDTVHPTATPGYADIATIVGNVVAWATAS